MGGQAPGKVWPIADGKSLIALRTWNDLMRRQQALDASGLLDAGPEGVGVIRIVELTEELGGPDSPNQIDRAATVVVYDTNDVEWRKTAPAHELGNAANPFGEQFHAVEGDWLVVFYHRQSGQYIPIFHWGLDRCTCAMKGTTGSGSKANCTADNVATIKGRSPLTDPDDATEELTVYNAHGWDFDDNALARIEWNVTVQRWDIFQIDCPAP